MDDGWSLIDDGSLMMDNGLPRTSYPSLIAFLAGAFVFQENNPRKISYASLVAFLAGAFVFQDPKNKLCVSDHVPSRGFCFPGKHTPKNKLCVSGRVPSKSFRFPGKHTRKKYMRL